MDEVQTPAQFVKVTPKESVFRRVAKFLLIIGTDDAARILSHLPPEQIEKIVPEIAAIRTVGEGEKQEVLAEFAGLLQQSREGGGIEKAREFLEAAFGAEKAAAVLEKAVVFPDGKPFEYLRDIEAEALQALLREELVATQCVILSHITPKTAAGAINLMAPPVRVEVIKRLAKMDKVDSEVLRRIDRQLYEKYRKSRAAAVPAKTVDGRGTLAAILRTMDAASADRLLKTLHWYDEDLSREMRLGLFTAEDVSQVDDQVIALELAAWEDSGVAVLIAGKPEAFREKIFANMSTGRGERILEEEEINRPFRKTDCDTATAAFLGKIREKIDWPPAQVFPAGPT